MYCTLSKGKEYELKDTCFIRKISSILEKLTGHSLQPLIRTSTYCSSSWARKSSIFRVPCENATKLMMPNDMKGAMTNWSVATFFKVDARPTLLPNIASNLRMNKWSKFSFTRKHLINLFCSGITMTVRTAFLTPRAKVRWCGTRRATWALGFAPPTSSRTESSRGQDVASLTAREKSHALDALLSECGCPALSSG